MIRETASLEPSTYPQTVQVKADLPNTLKHKEKIIISRQRNRSQMKEWESPEKEIKVMKASNLSDKEFKVMVIGMPNGMKKT